MNISINNNMNKNRETFKLDLEEGCEIIDGDHEDYKFIQEEIYDQGRWTISKTIIVKRLSDGKFFDCNFEEPSTECQGGFDDYNSELIFKEVFPVEKTIIVYQ